MQEIRKIAEAPSDKPLQWRLHIIPETRKRLCSFEKAEVDGVGAEGDWRELS